MKGLPTGIAIVLVTFACAGDNASSWRVASTRDIPDSTATVVRFANGRSLRLPLREATVHDALTGSSSVPWLLVSGWGCSDCDIQEQIFAIKADTLFGDKPLPAYSYPGAEVSLDDDSAFFRSRLFVGNCVAVLPRSATWLQEQKDSSGRWHRSVHMLVPRERLIDSQVPRTASLESEIVKSSKTHRCREIPGKQQTIF